MQQSEHHLKPGSGIIKKSAAEELLCDIFFISLWEMITVVILLNCMVKLYVGHRYVILCN